MLARLLVGVLLAVVGSGMLFANGSDWLLVLMLTVGTYSIGWCAGHWTADYKRERAQRG